MTDQITDARKKLTVTYGAFSCTLEGYDDPVAVVTAIAQQFRDLADRDQSFGAAPEQFTDADLRAFFASRDEILVEDARFSVSKPDEQPVMPPDSVSPVATFAQQAADEIPNDTSAVTKLRRIQAAEQDTDALTDASLDIERPEAPPSANALPDPDDQSVGRLLATADVEMTDPQTEKRQVTYAKRKAALASRTSEHDLNEAPLILRDLDRYKGDLAYATGAPTPAAPPDRPAPLLLSPSHRVDLVGLATPSSGTPDTEGFLEFAKANGAGTLSELLEAAAAYTLQTDPDQTFNRGDIMKTAQEAAPNTRFSRHDSLRSFGQLLLDGRIRKIGAGQFQLTEKSRFRDKTG